MMWSIQLDEGYAQQLGLEYFRFNLTFPLPRPTTQNHDLMGGRAGERAGDGMQLVAKRL